MDARKPPALSIKCDMQVKAILAAMISGVVLFKNQPA
jgi:hypothetical protein